MFRIAICDDERIICAEIENLISNYRCNIEKIDVEVFYSGKELCYFMKNGETFDLIILDIIMEGMNGIETAKFIREELKDENVQIIFISELENYHRELFDVRPMHFLLKPVDSHCLIKDIKKAIELAGRAEYSFCFKQGTVIYKKPIKEILYFEAKGRKVRIVTDDRTFFFYDSLKNIHSKLKDYHFLSIHQSYLVNYEHILEVSTNEIKITNEEILPVSRQKRKEVQDYMSTRMEYSCTK